MNSTKQSDQVINKKLLSSQDIIGRVLSFWRNTIILKQINGKLLDIACGDNRIVTQYKNGVGVDIVDYGKDAVIVDDISELPFEDQSFDTITIIASLNYFDTPQKVLNECFRLLNNEGKIIITMSNPYVMKIWHYFRESWAKKSALSAKEINDLFNKANFKLLKTKFFMLFINKVYIYTKLTR